MEKIKKLRKLFYQYKIDGYIIPKNDEFFGEYIPEFKDQLKYISGFSGSYGFALILKKKNILFVDGRYTLQAKEQSGKEFSIVNWPLKNSSSILNLSKKEIGFNPKLFNGITLSIFSKKLKCDFKPININLIKPKKNNHKFKKFFFLNKIATGENNKNKIDKVINNLKKNKMDFHFVTSSENVAWLLNIRGNDSNYSPIPNSHLIINSKKKIYLFCEPNKIDKKFKQRLKNVTFFNINFIDDFLNSISGKKIIIDNLTCSIHFKNILNKKNKIKQFTDPIYYLKSTKSKIEILNTKKVHEKDGAALTKFIFWVKNNYKKKKITEISAQEKLLKFRKSFSEFKSLSFPTISGSGPNGAIIHYNASKKNARILRRGDIYLVDSGGQYEFGTTDVTRTISLGNSSKRIIDIFTRVLKGHISVANYNIKKNTTGAKLDFVARKSLKEKKLDYAHGTGHGVGYYLNVHEGPQSISKFNKIKFLPGMILSNEPGYYEKGKFGIRIENLVFVKKIRNHFKFENLTQVHIEKSLINKKLMTKKEIRWLNNYHKNVYKKLKKYMNKNEISHLKDYCSNI